MKDLKNDKIEEVKRKQLIENILNRNNIDLKATIEAAKSGNTLTKEEVKRNKEKIARKSIEDIERQNKEQIRKLKADIFNKRVEEELKKWKKEESEQRRKRELRTNEILKEIDEDLKGKGNTAKNKYMEHVEANRKRLIRKENEQKIRKENEKRRKQENFLQQYEKLNITQNKNKNKSKKSNTNEKYDFIKKGIKKINKSKSKAKREIKGYKILDAINKYTSVMDFYHNNKEIIKNAREKINNVKEKGFRERLGFFSINHKKALQRANANEKNKEKFKPRYI